jgi:hypothetical protein
MGSARAVLRQSEGPASAVSPLVDPVAALDINGAAEQVSHEVRTTVEDPPAGRPRPP